MPNATLELTIRRSDDAYATDARLTTPTGTPTTLAGAVPLILDFATCFGTTDPTARGQVLTNALFANERLRTALARARAFADSDGAALRLRLTLAAPELHALPWELLRDPVDDAPLALNERLLLARLLDSPDLVPIAIPLKPDLRALVAVAAPHDLAHYGLAPLDVDGEVARLTSALGTIPAIILGDYPQARVRRVTLPALLAGLRDGAHILCLVCHGRVVAGEMELALEDETGATAWVAAGDLARAITGLQTRPLLAVIAACHSAGSYGGALAGLGPLLATGGVPAVLAFQDAVAVRTVRDLLTTFFAELGRDGAGDRALAAARVVVGAAGWWQATLWLRMPDGRLWRTAAPSAGGQPFGSIAIGNDAGIVQQINVSGGSVGNIIGIQTNDSIPPFSGAAGSSTPISHQWTRLAHYREQLAHWLDQLSIAGAANTRPEVTAGIREARAGIARAKAALRALGIEPGDDADDNP